jgi:hypothetical protein
VQRPLTGRSDADEACALGFVGRGVAARNVRRGAGQVLAEGFTTDGLVMSARAVAADDAQRATAADTPQSLKVLG